MSFRFVRRYGTIMLPLVLAACAGITPFKPPRETPAVQQGAAARPYHDSIDLAGRLSVHYQRNGREEALHGSFLWNQSSSQTTVTLLSPLGQTIAIIAVSPNGATLSQAGQAVRSAPDVDTLTANTLGWPLPVAGLRDWLQGYAVDRDGKHFVASPQEPRVTTRDGWQIVYANWLDDDTTSQQNRPKRIDLARNTERAGDVSIRIVIDTWQAH